MKTEWEYYLCQRVAAIEDEPTQAEVECLLEWILDNVPPACMYIAAAEAFLIPALYTKLAERMGRCKN